MPDIKDEKKRLDLYKEWGGHKNVAMHIPLRLCHASTLNFSPFARQSFAN